MAVTMSTVPMDPIQEMNTYPAIKVPAMAPSVPRAYMRPITRPGWPWRSSSTASLVRIGETMPTNRLGKKNSAVQTGNANPHLRQYQVLAEMPPNLGDDILPGMNCSGEIRIREIPEAVAVPIQAVHSEGSEHFVYVPAEDGKIRRQTIEMGGASDTLVQVKAGVEAGTRVLLRTPRPGELLLEEQATPQTVPAADKPSQAGKAI